MKLKLVILTVFIGLCINLKAQNIQNFLGVYTLTEVCISITFPGYSDTIDHEFEITESSVDSFDIQFQLALLSDTIRAVVLNDNEFKISLFTIPNELDNTLFYISGEGNVILDSINIKYGIGGSLGLFECDCEGIRKGTGVHKSKNTNSTYFLFPNPVKETLNIGMKSSKNMNQNPEVVIYDLKGNLVQKKQAILSNNLWVDVSDLKKGVYVLSILNDEKVEYNGSFIKE